MAISERAAAEILRRVGLSREQARLLLLTGVAGAGTQARTTTYDEARVRDLTQRPAVDQEELADLCPWGIHVTRLSRRRAIDLSRPWAEQAAEVAAQPPLPLMTAALLGVRISVNGGLPWVVTVSGLVVFGADTSGWDRREDGSVVYDLEPPGTWFEALDRRWFAFGPGRHWFFWDPWRLQQ